MKEKGKVPSEEELNKKLERQENDKWNYPTQRPPCPFPTAPKDSQQYQSFIKLLKDVVLNISMYDVLCGVPKYGKFIKDMLNTKGKDKLGDIVTLSKNYSCIIRKDLVLLAKESDPGVPTIPVKIGDRRFAKALCDLGSGVSLMPLSIAKKLNLDKDLKYTPVALQLADKSIVMPDGVIEDVLVQVDRFLVPADFIVMDIEEDKEVPLILGRPFLATGDAMIGAKNKDVTFNIDGETVQIEAEEVKKHPKDRADCLLVNIIDSLVKKGAQEVAAVDVLEN